MKSRIRRNTKPVTVPQLEKLGFTSDGYVQEEDFRYEHWEYTKNENYLLYTQEYDQEGQPTKAFFTVNDRELKGALPTKQEMKTLQKLL